MTVMTVLATVVVGVLAVGGALFVLASAVGMLRGRDALTRVNVMSAATGVGMPAIFLAAWVHDLSLHGFHLWTLVRVLVAVLGMVIVSSVASNALGRATYRSGAPIDSATRPNQLAEERDR